MGKKDGIMARQVGKLNALRVSKAKKRGYIGDGGGLYLQISADGAKSWVFRFRDSGKLREMGLGSLSTISLSEARDAALLCRKQRIAGLDPIASRNAAREVGRLEAAKAMTFKQCAEAYIEAHKASWSNAKHSAQWGSTLETYAYPTLGKLSVQAIDTGLIIKVLEPIWTSKTETASRVRGRIEAILDWAAARSFRSGSNPARWKGHLDQLLPERGKVRKVEHHAALPYAEITEFITALRTQEGTSAKALEFAILTAARTGEIIGATWDEIDLEARLWCVPASRMKAGKEHRVPLSKQALKIVKALHDNRSGPFVFPGAKVGRGLSNMALLTLLRRMGRNDLTAHGFRSTFRDWAAERTNFPSEAVEMALAHAVSDKVEAAYRRGDLFDRRRRIMEVWAEFCSATGRSSKNKVVQLNR